jgi:hypothetical protein
LPTLGFLLLLAGIPAEQPIEVVPQLGFYSFAPIPKKSAFHDLVQLLSAGSQFFRSKPAVRSFSLIDYLKK